MVGQYRNRAALLLGLITAACNGANPQSQSDLLGAAANSNSAAAAISDGTLASPTLASVSVMAPSAVTLSALGGVVIAAPSVQLISFTNDSEAASVQNFLLAWASSGAWEQMTKEYGVGALNVLPLVQSSMAWTQAVSDGVLTGDANTDIESALITHLDGADASWGQASSNTVFILEMPHGVAVAPSPGTPSACDVNTLAWHGAVFLPNANITLPYIVVPTCDPGDALTQVDSKTFALSHTLVGAVTDPTGQGFATIDAAHAVWQLVSQSPEASDLCNQAMYNSSHVLLRRQDVPQALARTWSNVAARSGHSPCVPALDNEVFLAAAALATDSIDVGLGDDPSVSSATTVGLSLSAGAAKDVPIALSSYPAQAGAFNVAAEEVGTQDLTLSLSSNSGSNGQTLSLNVAVGPAPKSIQQVVRITSSQGDVSFSQYFLVRQPSAVEG